MTRGKKVGWGCQNNFLRLKDAVFFQYWGALLARAKAQATVFVPRVKNARATFWPRFLSWTHWIPQSLCRPPSQRPAPSLLPWPPSRAHKTCHDSNSRLTGRLHVTAFAGNPRAEPESYNSSECASAEPQTTALCHPRIHPLASPVLPQPRPKQISEPPPTAPQTPPGCTHSGGAPAPTAHMSLLYGYTKSASTKFREQNGATRDPLNCRDICSIQRFVYFECCFCCEYPICFSWRGKTHGDTT